MEWSIPSIGERPHQPITFHFPHREFGQKAVTKRSFQTKWFSKWPWLHYNEENDSVFCFHCIRAYSQNKLLGVANLEKTYISTGFTNWKEATSRFASHESSRCHKDALLKMVTLLATTRDIGECLSKQHSKEKLENRQCFLKLLANVKFLSRQGLPFRGSGDGSDSNFLQLLKLRGEDDPRILNWIKKKSDKYTSPQIQNEIIKLFAFQVLREIATAMHTAPFFTIMVDETTDVSNREQVVICIRWVSKIFDVHEDFIGLYKVDQIDAGTLVYVIKDTLLRLNLSLTRIRGQCYDGAASMAGIRSGVAKQLLDEEPRALYTHCYGHALNLACGDAIKQCGLIKDALDITHELIKLLKKSPRRDSCFETLKTEIAPDTPGIRTLCPTRWTVRAEALKSVVDNYEVLNELWHECLKFVKETEMKARIHGVRSQMQQFDYFWGVTLGELILRHTDNLSRTLQKVDISAAEGQNIAGLTVKALQSLRTDNNFPLFWEKTTREADRLKVNEPGLPRRRKTPRRFESGSTDGYRFPDTPVDHYRQIYYEAIDLITTCINNRFDQPGYKIYRNIEDLLLKTANAEDYEAELKFVTQFYSSDFDGYLLKTQLEVFSIDLAANSESRGKYQLSDIIELLKSKSEAQKDILCEVCVLLKLLLVMPATNAISERSFSALRRVKSYLRSTMNQDRLTHLMVLHIHKELTDKLDLISIANDFVAGDTHRLTVFGTFTSKDTEIRAP